MERGSIPGYYFDEEKKKYFKITANHVAPPKAKYSKSNVKREHREKKKRKVEGEQEVKRHRQTVRPSRILERSVSTGGIGLQRELGRRVHVNDLNDRDAFFVSQLRLSGPELVRYVYTVGDYGGSGRMYSLEEEWLSFTTASCCHLQPIHLPEAIVFASRCSIGLIPDAI